MILYNILYNIHALNLIMNTPRYSKMSRNCNLYWSVVFEVMVICGVDQVKQKEDGKAIQTCWEKIINLLYDNNHRSWVEFAWTDVQIGDGDSSEDSWDSRRSLISCSFIFLLWRARFYNSSMYLLTKRSFCFWLLVSHSFGYRRNCHF